MNDFVDRDDKQRGINMPSFSDPDPGIIQYVRAAFASEAIRVELEKMAEAYDALYRPRLFVAGEWLLDADTFRQLDAMLDNHMLAGEQDDRLAAFHKEGLLMTIIYQRVSSELSGESMPAEEHDANKMNLLTMLSLGDYAPVWHELVNEEFRGVGYTEGNIAEAASSMLAKTEVAKHVESEVNQAWKDTADMLGLFDDMVHTNLRIVSIIMATKEIYEIALQFGRFKKAKELRKSIWTWLEGKDLEQAKLVRAFDSLFPVFWVD